MPTETFVEHVTHVSLDAIRVNPFQPRRDFSPDEIEDLAQSIQAVGLIHPPAVRALPDGKTYELISGERRFRACQHLRLPSIAVVVKDVDDQHSAEAALIENVQRVDLNAIEIAKALAQLIEDHKFRQEDLAKRIGKKRSTVANYLRLLTLPRPIQESVSRGLISMGHAKVILSVKDPFRKLLVHEQVLREKLTVRETEILCEQYQGGGPRKELPKKEEKERDANLELLERELTNKLGTKVEVSGSGKKGKLVLHYYNLDDLDRLLEGIGVQL